MIILGVLLFSIQAMTEDRGLAQMRSENRVALVIGNNSYQRPLTTLSNTLNDAQAIRSILSARGFEVIYKENVTHRTFDTLLEQFYKKLGYGGVGLLYFSGHGLEFDGQNYLIPTDAKIGAKSDTKYEAVALNKITSRIQKIGNRLNIVILDACRNDPFAKAYGMGGLAKTEPPVGLIVSYATGAGKVSSDGRVGGNGLFTQYLIENMQKPLSLRDVFQATRASVYDASGGTQFPAVYNQIIRGDFYFTLPTVHIEPSQTSYVALPPVQSQSIALQSTPSVSTSTSKWITPTDKEVTWEKAKQICRDNGGRLPTLEELKKVVIDCGGEVKYDNSEEWNRNKNNSSYQSCYKKNGFEYADYWSSTMSVSDSSYAWNVRFVFGISNCFEKSDVLRIRCIR